MATINLSAAMILKAMQANPQRIAKLLDELVLGAKEINASQKLVWRYLYLQSYFDKELSCRITSRQIAEGTAHKPTSIRGMIRSLERNGYVYTKMDSHDSINTFFLTLPADALEKIQQAESRKAR